MVRAARVTGRERHSRVVRPASDSAPRGGTGSVDETAMVGMTDRGLGFEPAGGTTTRSSAGRAGFLFCGDRMRDTERAVEMGDETATRELPKAYAPADVESAIYARWLAADVFAPDGAGSRADPAKQP